MKKLEFSATFGTMTQYIEQNADILVQTVVGASQLAPYVTFVPNLANGYIREIPYLNTTWDLKGGTCSTYANGGTFSHDPIRLEGKIIVFEQDLCLESMRNYFYGPYASQNINDNTTVVNWYLDIIEVNGTWTNNPTGSYSININGSVYSGTVPGYDNHATTRIRSGSTTVTHDDDGTKTINVSASASGVNALGSASISAKGFALTTIPRATTPSFSGGSSWDCGDAKTIDLPRASSSFTHVVTYKFGSASGTISSSASSSVS